MDSQLLETKFNAMGARLKFADFPIRRRNVNANGISIDIRTDRRGEFFEINDRGSQTTPVHVLDVQAQDRHLLLLARNGDEKQKFLCGHDERHWFVAAIPEAAPVGTVRQAKEALKPAEVQVAQARLHVASVAGFRRKNAAFVRQGEWFFIPDPTLIVDSLVVLKNEPLRRGNGGKPHWVDFCYRTGGETVYVCSHHPNGVTSHQYRQILSANTKAKNWGWRMMQRNAGVFVRGRVRHADHRTVMLHCWHRVLMNTETQAKAMRHVAFLD